MVLAAAARCLTLQHALYLSSSRAPGDLERSAARGASFPSALRATSRALFLRSEPLAGPDHVDRVLEAQASQGPSEVKGLGRFEAAGVVPCGLRRHYEMDGNGFFKAL